MDPSSALPQHATAPPVTIAHTDTPLPEIAVTPVRSELETVTGEVAQLAWDAPHRFGPLVVPISPNVASPTHFTVPDTFAHVASPVENAVALLKTVVGVGVHPAELHVDEGGPSCPWSSLPQHFHEVPTSAHV
jgi:hypothetical protein